MSRIFFRASTGLTVTEKRPLVNELAGTQLVHELVALRQPAGYSVFFPASRGLPGCHQRMVNQGKRIARVIAGGFLVGLGLVLSIPGVPGPGIAVAILGLSILSVDFELARRLMRQLKNLARRALSRGRDSSAAL